MSKKSKQATGEKKKGSGATGDIAALAQEFQEYSAFLPEWRAKNHDPSWAEWLEMSHEDQIQAILDVR